MRARVIVVGGGIIGILTAYFLNKRGCEVTVLERKNGIGQMASLANGSQISFSHLYPINFNKKGKFSFLFQKKEKFDSVIKTKSLGVKSFLAQQKEEMYHIEKHIAKLSHLAKISLDALNEIVESESLQVFFKNAGIIHLFNSKSELLAEAKRAKLYDQPFEILTKSTLLKYEQGIANFAAKFTEGVRYSEDKTSNCHDICKILEGILKERGVVFNLKTSAIRFKSEGKKIKSVIAEDGTEFVADYFICANGTEISKVLSSLGLSYPIFPIRGYSYTFNMEKSNYAPFMGLVDRKRKMVYSVYKNYLRIAGFFDLGVENAVEIASRMKDFEGTIFDVFPLLRRNGIVHKWTENRPCTPSSVPIIGMSDEFSNLLINGGHGALGFTLSFGSGKIISELI